MKKKWIGGEEGDFFVDFDGVFDVVDTRAGDDVVIVGDHDVKVIIGAGNDQVFVGNGDNTILPGEGDDIVYGGNGNNVVRDAGGNDQVTLGTGDNTVFGGSGDELIQVGHSPIYASYTDQFGNEIWYEYPDEWAGGDNRVDAGAGNDIITAQAGDDTLSGGSGHDVIIAGRGDDSVYGGSGHDYADGGYGDDLLKGGSGNDLLVAGRDGIDILLGESGNDRLYAGIGDTVNGGSGHDIFAFDPNGSGAEGGIVYTSKIEVVDLGNIAGLSGFDVEFTRKGDLHVVADGYDFTITGLAGMAREHHFDVDAAIAAGDIWANPYDGKG